MGYDIYIKKYRYNDHLSEIHFPRWKELHMFVSHSFPEYKYGENVLLSVDDMIKIGHYIKEEMGEIGYYENITQYLGEMILDEEIEIYYSADW